MGKIYPDSETAMWAYIAGEIKECPCSLTVNNHIRVLASIGGALDPSKVHYANDKERYMLIFANKLAAMRAELEALRAKFIAQKQGRQRATRAATEQKERPGISTGSQNKQKNCPHGQLAYINTLDRKSQE